MAEGSIAHPSYEPGQPAFEPAQAQVQATLHAAQLAMMTGCPAIAQAAHALDADSLRRELAAGVAVDLLSLSGGQTPLQLVCQVMNTTVVYRRGGTDDAFLGWAAQPAERRRVIDEGINADRLACVELLLAHGASPRTGGIFFPPLTDAVAQGSLALVNMLLDAGSDTSVLRTPPPLEFACSPLGMAVISLFYLVRSGRVIGYDHIAIVDALLKAGADANPPEIKERTLMEWAIGVGHRRLWPVLLRGGTLLPTRELNWASYVTHRAHPYLQKLDAAGGWTAHEKAHRARMLAIFVPKFTHLLPPELVPLILEFSFHLGFY